MNSACAECPSITETERFCDRRDPKRASDTNNRQLDGWLRPGWITKAAPDCEPISVLFVHDEGSDIAGLGTVLGQTFSADVIHAHGCQEASRLLREGPIPHLVFTETKVSDGSWEDILQLANSAAEPVNVFIVSRIGNIGLYTEAMMQGAFDFITPNIPPAAFAQTVKDASEDVLRRRDKKTTHSD